jgi:GST-like protein
METDQPIIVYGVNSPNVLKIAIMLEELDLAYELRHVALFKGEQFTPQFLALNPIGKVPVILDPRLDIPLAESGAILIWLAERSGKLLPVHTPARQEVFQWLMVQMSSVGPMLGQFTHFSLLPPGSEPYSFGRYGALAEKLYRDLDNRLGKQEWLAGGAYSIADIATFPWGEYLPRHGFDDEAFPALLRWRRQIAARPPVIRARQRTLDAFSEISAQTASEASEKDLDRFFGRTAAMPQADYSIVKRMK